MNRALSYRHWTKLTACLVRSCGLESALFERAVAPRILLSVTGVMGSLPRNVVSRTLISNKNNPTMIIPISKRKTWTIYNLYGNKFPTKKQI